MTVKRFEPDIETERFVGDQAVERAAMETDPEGEWVKYEDHQQEVERLESARAEIASAVLLVEARAEAAERERDYNLEMLREASNLD